MQESLRNHVICPQLSIDHLRDAEDLINDVDENTKESSKALRINLKMRSYLLEVKKQLIEYRQKCVEELTRCEKSLEAMQLEQINKNNRPRAVNIFKSLHICGAPFFKEPGTYHNSPPNTDYLYRKQILKEYFPFDDQKSPAVWSLNDKREIILACKIQMINYIYIHRTEFQGIKNYGSLEEETTLNLFNLVNEKEKFKFNWDLIAYNAFNYRFSKIESQAMWEQFLCPIINRKEWQLPEEMDLSEIAKSYNFQNWTLISETLNTGRTPYQCFVHFQTKLSSSTAVKNSKWNSNEDQILLAAIEKYRINAFIPWNRVAVTVPERNKFQCYERYMFTLNPDLHREKFSTEEDCIIVSFVAEYGENNFGKIPLEKLPGRTLKQIRGRYWNVLKMVGKTSEWTSEEDEILYKYVLENGTKDWVTISNIIKTHSRVSCRTRYNTIEKYLKNNPNMKVSDIPSKKKSQSACVTQENWLETFIKIKSEAFPAEEDGIETGANEKKKKKSVKKNQFLENYFQNSYNFTYKPKIVKKQIAVFGLKCLQQRLKYVRALPIYHQLSKFTEAEMKVLEKLEKQKLTRTVVTVVEGVPNLVSPPNWNNIVGYRGVLSTLLYRSFTITKHVAEDNAYEKFKERYFFLFYWPAMLSNMQKEKIISTNAPNEISCYNVPSEQASNVINLFKININEKDPNSAISIDIAPNFISHLKNMQE